MELDVEFVCDGAILVGSFDSFDFLLPASDALLSRR